MAIPDVSGKSITELISLKERNAVVTGGARGIGLAICERFAEAGANVLIGDLDEQLAQEVARFGIRVAIIEPGITKSAIFAKNVDSTVDGSDYEPHLRRMFQFYAAGQAQAADPFEVANIVEHAITTDRPALRYTVSWGGPEIVSARQRISDEEWVELGAIEDDDEYYRAFSDTFGVDITRH